MIEWDDNEFIIKKHVISTLGRWLKEKYSNPIYLEIWPTKKCNLKCRFCSTTYSSNNFSEMPEVSYSRLKKLVREGHRMGIKKVVFAGGGEPFLQANMIKLMEEVKRLGLNGFVISNGSLLTEKNIRKIVKMRWDTFIFSLDAPDAETHDYLRGVKGTYEKVIKAMKIFNYYKMKLNSKLPVVGINMVITKSNYFKIGEIIEMGQELNWHLIQFQSLMLNFPDAKLLQLNKKDRMKFKSIIKEILKKVKEYNQITNIQYYTDEKYFKKANKVYEILLSQTKLNDLIVAPCFEPWYKIIITPEGNMGPCPYYAGISNVNVSSYSLKDAWSSNSFNDFRNKILSKNISDTCKKCCICKVFDNIELRKQLTEFLNESGDKM